MSDSLPRRRGPVCRVGLLAGVAAPVVHVGAMAVVGAISPGYSHVEQFVSELGAAEAPWQHAMNLGGLMPAGILTLVFVAAIWRCVPARGLRVVSAILVGMVGLARLTAGIFPCDPGCATPPLTTAGMLHGVAGVVALLSGALAPLPFTIGRRWGVPGWLSGLSLFASAGAAAVMATAFWQGPESGLAGLWQRILLLLFYVWLVSAAAWFGAFRRRRPA